jgi:hypothetical protein
MMRRLLLVLLLATTGLTPVSVHAQITTNVFFRVFQIKVDDKVGTAFALDVDGRQYLITAKHMVAEWKPGEPIDILKMAVSGEPREEWSRLKVANVFPCADPADVAVIVPSEVVTRYDFPLLPISDSVKLVIGQDVYFIGFPVPRGIRSRLLIPMDSTYPYPLGIAKRGIVSAIAGTTEAPQLLLDGYNIPGFSGSPIIFRDASQPAALVFYVAGVVTAFIPDLAHVTKPEPIEPHTDISKIEGWRLTEGKNGELMELKDTDEIVPLNSGIVIGYLIKPAIDLIHKHPIGPKVTK